MILCTRHAMVANHVKLAATQAGAQSEEEEQVEAAVKGCASNLVTIDVGSAVNGAEAEEPWYLRRASSKLECERSSVPPSSSTSDATHTWADPVRGPPPAPLVFLPIPSKKESQALHPQPIGDTLDTLSPTV